MRSKLAAIGLALVIFAAGVATGVGVDRRWLAEPAAADLGPGPGRHFERFRSRLDLDPQQAAAIDAILAEAREQAMAVRTRSQQAILSLLRPEQAARYRAMIERHQRRHPPGRGGPGPGAPGRDPAR
jgi:Spy/CpxP family protein refolding chaperone